MDIFLEKFLIEKKGDLEKICPNYPIRITETFTNESCSVLWVFWELMDNIDKKFQDRPYLPNVIQEYNDTIKEKEEFIKKINEKLNKYSAYLSGKMCQILKLKYGPDIRFKPCKMQQKAEPIREDFEENIQNVVDEEIKEKYK